VIVLDDLALFITDALRDDPAAKEGPLGKVVEQLALVGHSLDPPMQVGIGQVEPAGYSPPRKQPLLF
jgi:hypothetical protein